MFIQANSADPDKMPQYVAFFLGLRLLAMYLFRGFQYAKGPGEIAKCNNSQTPVIFCSCIIVLM